MGDNPSPADLIRQLREEHGSHDKLAAALGTSRQRVIGWEKGQAPGGEYRDKLAALSGLPADDFRYGPTQRGVSDRLDAIEKMIRDLTEVRSRDVDEIRRTLVRLSERVHDAATILRGLTAVEKQMRELVGRLEALAPASTPRKRQRS